MVLMWYHAHFPKIDSFSDSLLFRMTFFRVMPFCPNWWGHLVSLAHARLGKKRRQAFSHGPTFWCAGSRFVNVACGQLHVPILSIFAPAIVVGMLV